MQFFLAQNQSFGDTIQYFWCHYGGTPKDNFFALTALHGGPWGGRRGPFLAQKPVLFYATPISPPFFGLRRTQLNGIITSPHPEVTLDKFGFPVGGRPAARRVVFRPPGRILAFFDIFGHFWYPHVALSGGLNGSNIPPWMCSVMFNQFWGLVQPICGHCGNQNKI